MQRFMRLAYAHPWVVVLTLAVITAASLFLARGLRLDPSVDGMMTDDPEARAIYARTVETFGTDQVTVICLRDPDLFDPDRLALIDELAYQLEGLPGVVRVESLFSAADFRDDQGTLRSGPLMRQPPADRDEARAILAQALENPLVAGNLLSRDGTTTSVNVFIEPDQDDPQFYETLAASIETLLAPCQGRFEEAFQLGNPYFRTVISQTMIHDQMRLVPLSVAVLILTLVLMTRSPASAILPLLTAGTSVCWMAAFMALADIPLNILTIIVPSLIIVIGSTEDIHLISEYREGLHKRGPGKLAFDYMVSKMGVVILITSLTTFLGFASITVNKIEILRQFGMAAAFGLLVNPVITVALIPAYLRLTGGRGASPLAPAGPPPRGDEDENAEPEPWKKNLSIFDLLGRAASSAANRHDRKLVAGLLLFAAGLALFSFNVRLNNDILGVFKKSSPIRQRTEAMAAHLPGVQTFSIAISSGVQGMFKKPEALRAVAAIQDYIAASPEFDASFSLADSLRLINREMHGGAQAHYAIPATEDQVAQYLLFIHDSDLRRSVNPDFSQFHILVRHSLQSSYEQKQALEGLRAFMAKTLGPHYQSAFTGESMLILGGADSIAEGQALSIALLLGIIFLIMSVLFVNVKAGLLSLLPNIFPVLIMFGTMGITGIPLNIGTAMVAAIAIGIAVDDTIHFMTRYNKEMLRLKDQHRAMEVCIHAEIRPVTATSLALALGFSVLLASEFVTIIQFGALSALVMLAALIGDLLLTGPLLANTKLLTLWDMLSLHVDPQVIRQSEFFRELRPWHIKKIILMGRIQERRAGESIFDEWDQGDSMYIILSGEVRAFSIQEDTGREVPYALFGVGDVFGQTAMLDPGPRSYSARAFSDLHLVEISHADFQRLHRLYPRLASLAHRNLARILGHRLAIANVMYYQKSLQNQG